MATARAKSERVLREFEVAEARVRLVERLVFSLAAFASLLAIVANTEAMTALVQRWDILRHLVTGVLG
jgi:hypothetical protein